MVTRYLDDAYKAWLASPASCCLVSQEQQPLRASPQDMKIEHDQPRLVPPPIPEPVPESLERCRSRPRSRSHEWTTRTKSMASRASSRGSFSVKRRLNAYNGLTPRRPQIGAPSDFRHLDGSALNEPPRRPDARFRPLELSIYLPENQLSPMLPHFGGGAAIDDLTFPEPSHFLSHSRNTSSMSYHIPRKPLRASSIASSDDHLQFATRPGSRGSQELLAIVESDLPTAPPPARLRAMTEPPAYQRVKSALHEKFELEQRIRDVDSAIDERRSVYLASRPTSRATLRPPSISVESQEPLPLTNPSFAQRVAMPRTEQRPRTAPSQPTVRIPARSKTFSEAAAMFDAQPDDSRFTPSPITPQNQGPPPPPLPLVLQAPSRPTLRKKKSFSRVSSWLFPSISSTGSSSHGRNISLDSVTNTPKHLKSREGFYQCVAPPPPQLAEAFERADLPRRDSSLPHDLHVRSDSSATATTVSTLESDLDEPPSLPTAASWTPVSSPGGAAKSPASYRSAHVVSGLAMNPVQERELTLTKMRTFGYENMAQEDVGVAF